MYISQVLYSPIVTGIQSRISKTIVYQTNFRPSGQALKFGLQQNQKRGRYRRILTVLLRRNNLRKILSVTDYKSALASSKEFKKVQGRLITRTVSSSARRQEGVSRTGLLNKHLFSIQFCSATHRKITRTDVFLVISLPASRFWTPFTTHHKPFTIPLTHQQVHLNK